MKHSCIFGSIIFLAFMVIGRMDAAVTDSTQVGFSVKHEKNSIIDPMTLFNVFSKDIGQWWDPDHTWSGKSENLYIQSYIGGCFGEQMESGRAVKHMDVIFLDPGKMLRMEGSLGPLQQFAVQGIMTMELTRKGDSTHVSLKYTVGGYIPGGAAKFAAAVDQVIGNQFTRFIRFAEGKK